MIETFNLNWALKAKLVIEKPNPAWGIDIIYNHLI